MKTIYTPPDVKPEHKCYGSVSGNKLASKKDIPRGTVQKCVCGKLWMATISPGLTNYWLMRRLRPWHPTYYKVKEVLP